MKVRCAHSNAVNSMALAGIIWGRHRVMIVAGVRSRA